MFPDGAGRNSFGQLEQIGLSEKENLLIFMLIGQFVVVCQWCQSNMGGTNK